MRLIYADQSPGERGAMLLAVAAASALPSLLLALMVAHVGGLLTGMAIWLLSYFGFGLSARGVRLARHRRFGPAANAALVVRLLMSLSFVGGFLVDIFPGGLAVILIEGAGQPIASFTGALLATLLHGSFLTLGVVILALAIAPFVKPGADDPNACRNCGYDIRASRVFGRCPECGAPCGRPVYESDSEAETLPAEQPPPGPAPTPPSRPA